MEDISVVSLAEKSEPTPNYFSTVFHEQMNQTFSAYITSVRIEHAKEILFTRPEIRACEAAHTNEADYISKPMGKKQKISNQTLEDNGVV